MGKSITENLAPQTTSADVLRVVYNTMSDTFKERIEPLFDEGEGKLADFGKALENYLPLANEFMYELINQIGRINVNARRFTSPLKELKKGMLEFGDTIEDVYVEPVTAMAYEAEVPNDNPGDVWQTFKPKTDVVFYRENKEFVYPLTLNKDILKRAFRSYADLDKYISAQMQAMYNADEIDDYLLTKDLLTVAHDDNAFFKVHVDDVTDEASAKALCTTVNALIETIKYPSRLYNSKGVMSWSTQDKLVLITTPAVSKFIDVNVLAYAFNMEKADIIGRKIVVDSLPSGVIAMLIDTDAFQIYDTLIDVTTSGLNARHLTTNYFLHHHGIFAMAPYWPMIEFTTAEVAEPTAVAITGASELAKGKSTNYVATVTGGATGAVKWSITGNPQYATIDQNGKLTVGKHFKGGSLTVVATSVEKASITKSQAVTIS